eukprot:gene29293-36318_t
MHALLAPCLTTGTAPGGLYSSASVSANMVSNTSTAVPSVSGGPLPTSFQPLIANLYLLLRSLVDKKGMTVLVANVLESRDSRALTSTYSTSAPGGSGGGGGASYAAGGRNVSMTAGPSAASGRLPVGTGASSSSDLYDIVLVLSASDGGEQKESELFSVFNADIALRPPQYAARPSSCELRIAKI